MRTSPSAADALDIGVRLSVVHHSSCTIDHMGCGIVEHMHSLVACCKDYMLRAVGAFETAAVTVEDIVMDQKDSRQAMAEHRPGVQDLETRHKDYSLGSM